ncbi:hypothetical protein H6A18_09535 [Collinsella tanakaei]|uniref:hypothetical protein n=1 Tax=Collinsella tanakaei TaxID=626935 RepID=UPI001958427D|nr:hypothetical protein [Collinsella tanakaei]MBM6756743.1 hypothetical protein [Collinsella tanakaei]
MSGARSPLSTDPYRYPRFGDSPARDIARVVYADGTRAHKGDRVLDQNGRHLTVIGLNGTSGHLITLDADCRMVGIDPLEVELVNHDE